MAAFGIVVSHSAIGQSAPPAMAVTDQYLQYVLEQLALLPVTSRRMFGGVGLYSEGVFFALIAGDVLYLKVGDANRSYYEERGMRRFQPYPGKQHLSMNYYELPAEVLEDSQQCGEWARRSLAMAGADKPRRSRSSAARTKLKAP